jgi:hypothetical protein
MPLLPVPAYGWKWCKQLAELGQDVLNFTPDNWNYEAPNNNADSIALFASGECGSCD